jgi:hypothetical protein
MKFVVAVVVPASDGSDGPIGEQGPWSVLDALQG